MVCPIPPQRYKTIPIIRIKWNCNRPQFCCYLFHRFHPKIYMKYAWRIVLESVCNSFGFDFDFLVSLCLLCHSNVLCVITLNIKPGHSESDRKIWNQTGNALMNANKKQNYVFLFTTSHYWPNKTEGNTTKMRHTLLISTQIIIIMEMRIRCETLNETHPQRSKM